MARGPFAVGSIDLWNSSSGEKFSLSSVHRCIMQKETKHNIYKGEQKDASNLLLGPISARQHEIFKSAADTISSLSAAPP